MNHIELGILGENLAVNHLQAKGYKVLERNFRWKKLEIDIICRKEQQLVIVEVKTRNTAIYGEPHESVTRKKQRQIIKATNEYIQMHDIDLEVRLDVISIVTNQYRTDLEHIESAFYPLK